MLWSNLPYAFTSKEQANKHSPGVWLHYLCLGFQFASFGDKFLHTFVGDRGVGAMSNGHLDVPDVCVQVFL